jgi:uncharacterized DUF497 family protein
MRSALFSIPIAPVQRDTRCDYREDRHQLTGRIERRLLVVVYATRSGAIRIISTRKANHREVKHRENRTNHH